MNIETTMEGGCLCTDIRYSVSGAPFDADYCHCRMCQKAAGAMAVSWMDFRLEQVTWLSGKPTEYASSESVRRGFCVKCGSTLSFRDTRHAGYYSLSIASLDDPNQVRPNYHIHTDSQVEWLRIDDDCEKYPKNRNG